MVVLMNDHHLSLDYEHSMLTKGLVLNFTMALGLFRFFLALRLDRHSLVLHSRTLLMELAFRWAKKNHKWSDGVLKFRTNEGLVVRFSTTEN